MSSPLHSDGYVLPLSLSRPFPFFITLFCASFLLFSLPSNTAKPRARGAPPRDHMRRGCLDEAKRKKRRGKMHEMYENHRERVINQCEMVEEKEAEMMGKGEMIAQCAEDM